MRNLFTDNGYGVKIVDYSFPNDLDTSSLDNVFSHYLTYISNPNSFVVRPSYSSKERKYNMITLASNLCSVYQSKQWTKNTISHYINLYNKSVSEGAKSPLIVTGMNYGYNISDEDKIKKLIKFIEIMSSNYPEIDILIRNNKSTPVDLLFKAFEKVPSENIGILLDVTSLYFEGNTLFNVISDETDREYKSEFKDDYITEMIEKHVRLVSFSPIPFNSNYGDSSHLLTRGSIFSNYEVKFIIDHFNYLIKKQRKAEVLFPFILENYNVEDSFNDTVDFDNLKVTGGI